MPDLDSKPELTFLWFVRERRQWVLMLAVLAMSLFVGGYLLLFQVVYPATKHRRLAPQRVLLLDMNNPAARQVVNAISDRDFLVMRDTTSSSASVNTRSPLFVPTFKDFDFRLHDFVESTNASATLPRIFQPEHAPLPPLPAVPAVARTSEMKSQRLHAVLVDGLKDRAITRAVTIDDAEASDMKLRIAVGKDGRVTSVIPVNLSPAQMPLFARVRSNVQQLRFAADGTHAVSWGTVTFQWRADAKP